MTRESSCAWSATKDPLASCKGMVWALCAADLVPRTHTPGHWHYEWALPASLVAHDSAPASPLPSQTRRTWEWWPRSSRCGPCCRAAAPEPWAAPLAEKADQLQRAEGHLAECPWCCWWHGSAHQDPASLCTWLSNINVVWHTQSFEHFWWLT